MTDLTNYNKCKLNNCPALERIHIEASDDSILLETSGCENLKAAYISVGADSILKNLPPDRDLLFCYIKSGTKLRSNLPEIHLSSMIHSYKEKIYSYKETAFTFTEHQDDIETILQQYGAIKENTRKLMAVIRLLGVPEISFTPQSMHKAALVSTDISKYDNKYHLSLGELFNDDLAPLIFSEEMPDEGLLDTLMNQSVIFNNDNDLLVWIDNAGKHDQSILFIRKQDIEQRHIQDLINHILTNQENLVLNEKLYLLKKQHKIIIFGRPKEILTHDQWHYLHNKLQKIGNFYTLSKRALALYADATSSTHIPATNTTTTDASEHSPNSYPIDYTRTTQARSHLDDAGDTVAKPVPLTDSDMGATNFQHVNKDDDSGITATKQPVVSDSDAGSTTAEPSTDKDSGSTEIKHPETDDDYGNTATKPPASRDSDTGSTTAKPSPETDSGSTVVKHPEPDNDYGNTASIPPASRDSDTGSTTAKPSPETDSGSTEVKHPEPDDDYGNTATNPLASRDSDTGSTTARPSPETDSGSSEAKHFEADDDYGNTATKPHTPRDSEAGGTTAKPAPLADAESGSTEAKHFKADDDDYGHTAAKPHTPRDSDAGSATAKPAPLADADSGSTEAKHFKADDDDYGHTAAKPHTPRDSDAGSTTTKPAPLADADSGSTEVKPEPPSLPPASFLSARRKYAEPAIAATPEPDKNDEILIAAKQLADAIAAMVQAADKSKASKTLKDIEETLADSAKNLHTRNIDILRAVKSQMLDSSDRNLLPYANDIAKTIMTLLKTTPNPVSTARSEFVFNKMPKNKKSENLELIIGRYDLVNILNNLSKPVELHTTFLKGKHQAVTTIIKQLKNALENHQKIEPGVLAAALKDLRSHELVKPETLNVIEEPLRYYLCLNPHLNRPLQKS